MAALAPFRRRALLGLLTVAVLARPAMAADPPRISMGTAMEGGNVSIYGAAFIQAMRSVDPILEIRGVPTKGIKENLTMLEAGELDIALVLGEVAYEAFAGVGRPPTKLTVVSVMYSSPGMFVVRADSRYRRITDLKGRPVVWNGRDSGAAVQARYVMNGLDLDIDKDFTPLYTENLVDGPPMVNEGQAAAMWGGGRRWPGFVAIANTVRGARFIVPTAAEIERIRAKHPFFSVFTVPAREYAGQYDPLVTVGTWSFVLARDGLDEAIGYRLGAGLHKIQRTSQLSKQLDESTVQNTLGAIGDASLLQPGVAKYYREKDLLPK